MPKSRSAPSGAYSGRLAFGDDDFHVDPDGNRVVTDDGGKTWRYATDDDVSHFDRYHERFVTVESTANQLAELSVELGREQAELQLLEAQPHHFRETADDIAHHSDAHAETLTSHTEADHE